MLKQTLIPAGIAFAATCAVAVLTMWSLPDFDSMIAMTRAMIGK